MIRPPRRRRRGAHCSNIRVYRGDVGARDNSGHDAGALRRADLGAVLRVAGVRAGRRLRRPGARVLDVRSVHRAAGPGPALAGRRLGRARPPLSLLLRGEDADEEPAAALDGQALVPVWWTSNVGSIAWIDFRAASRCSVSEGKTTVEPLEGFASKDGSNTEGKKRVPPPSKSTPGVERSNNNVAPSFLPSVCFLRPFWPPAS